MTFQEREESQRAGEPIELFEIQHGAQVWRFTSADTTISYGGHDFEPEIVAAGEIDENGEDDQGRLELEMPRNHDIPALFIPGLPATPVTLVKYAGHRNESEFVVDWTGEVASCSIKDSKATLTCLPISRALRQQIPRQSFQGGCNWTVFSAQCGLNREDYRVPATVVALTGNTVQATEFDAYEDGYFRAGHIEDADGEIHMITDHTGDTLTLLTGFRSLSPGDTVYAFPGCPRTVDGCKAFGNARFWGFPWTPRKNPYITGVS